MKNKMVQELMNRMARNRAAKRKTAMKLTAAALCAALALGGTGTVMHTLAAEEGSVQETEAEAGADADGAAEEAGEAEGSGTGAEKGASGNGATGMSAKGSKATEEKLAKEETVYVWANADGSTRKIVVSDWLKNPTGAESLVDVSELTDIENVNGDETFVPEKNSVKVWDTDGADIYYQGSIEKELPVKLTITYLLDGKEISPENLAGKSGKLTMRFAYANEQYEYAQVEGTRTKVYVPFAVVTGMLLDNEVFTNVEVSGGKLINDGDRMVVMGYALPGLQENLGVDSEKLDFPESFEVTADVKDFEMGMTVTIATNDLFDSVDMDNEDLVDGLNGALGELTDAMAQLMDGSSQLYDGLCTLLEKSGELVAGIDKLSDGAQQLRNGVGSLDEGAAKLQNGTASLQAGLNTLVSKNGELNGGARQVFDTLLATARTQLGAAGLEVPGMTVENYGDVLNGVIASLDGDAVYRKAYEQVSAAVEAKRGEIEAAVTAVVREQVVPQVTEAVRQGVEEQVAAGAREKVVAAVLAQMNMTKEDYEAAVAAGMIDEEQQAQIAGAIDSQMASEVVRAQIAETVEAQMGTADIQALIEGKVNEQMASDAVRETIAANTELQVQKAIADNMAGDEVQSQLTAASEGAKAVIALKQSLDTYNVFYLGVQAYTAGVAEAAGGAGQLKSGVDELRGGTGQLYAGASELCDGISTMKSAAPALTEGITQLRDGAGKLDDGLQEFNNEGIQKLVDAVDDDLDGLVERLRATRDASRNYNNFSGIGRDMDGRVKFIYRTDAIETGKE